MSDLSQHEFQPGDHTPTDHATREDLLALEHGQLRAGDHAPKPRRKGPTRKGAHISGPFIRRPVATVLLSAAIIIAGAVAYKLLPVASLPDVDYPVISISASMPGMDPETMASSIATPLERQFSRIAGVNEMTSSSSTGSTSITLQFDLSRDVNGAARDVQAAINAARSQLPANLPSNPNYRKINPSDSPILMMGLTSKTLSVPQIYDAADSILAQKLASISGIGQVFVGGSAKPAVRVEANPNQLTHYGLGLESLRSAIATFNVNQPKGYLNGDDKRWMVSTTDQLFGADAYRPLVIATSKGPVSSVAASNGLQSNVASAANNSSLYSTSATATSTAIPSAATSNYTSAAITPSFSNYGVVRLGDIAEVDDSVEDVHTGGTINGVPAIIMMVFKAPGANIIESVNAVQKDLPQLQASIPPSIHLFTVLDRTASIRASVDEITRTMIITVVLVILVVFFFLREVRSTLIPSVSLPLSLLGTFGVMYLLGYTLDNLSLMALTICTGFVVDDAIVVIENISRHLEDGLSPYEAAMIGSQEIGFTVLSMSISLIAVFIPLLLMGGIMGLLFREFAVTLSVSILVSLCVSLTTTPMLSAKFLKPYNEQKHGRLYMLSERFFDWILAEYELGLSWVLKHQLPVLLIFLLTVALNVFLFAKLPFEFFPQQDSGRLAGNILGQQDVSFLKMKEKIYEVAQRAGKDPAVENVMAFLGGGGPGGGSSNSGRFFVMLKPLEDRPGHVSADEVLNRLRPKLSGIPGAQVFMQVYQELRIGGRSSSAQYQYTLTADSVKDLNAWSPRMLEAMQKLPELRDVNTDQMENGLRTQLVIDRDTASRLGVSPLAIDNTLSDAFGQRQVSTTYRPLNQYHVVMEVAPQFQQDPDAIRNIYIKNSVGQQIPLTAIAHFEQQRVPLQVSHQGLVPAATISFNLGPGVALSQATEAIERARLRIGAPSSITGLFAGTAAQAAASFKSMPLLILLALFTVYLVLGMLYESLVHPLTILSTLPSAGVGALLALLMTNTPMSVIGLIGLLLLVGIVKKNAIMMIDFALVSEREHNMTPQEAIREACLLRFRPIMMTTMAALLGAVPLAIGTGMGSELRRPLGISIIGGLIVSQCLTLFTTPVIYLFVERARRWVLARVGSRSVQPAPVAGD